MTIQHLPQARQGGDPEVIAHLQQTIADLTEEGDRLAGASSTAHADATRLQQHAETCMQQALAVRSRIERWRRHLELEQGAPADIPGEPIDDEGAVQTVLFPRPRLGEPFPLVRSLRWGDPPHRRCNGCQGILRDATPEEIEAVAAGLDVPDVRRECPDCRLAAAAERRSQPYPPVTPPDAA